MITSTCLQRSILLGEAIAVCVILLGSVHSAGGQDAFGVGYFPTLEEVDLLGGESRMMYPRGVGGLNVAGPDAGSLTASGIWHQDEEPLESFYGRHDGFFTPLDNTLGLFVPRELALLESGDDPSSERLTAYGDLGFPLTRNYNPDLAMLKAGPLHLDLLSLSYTLLHSDYRGSSAAFQDDGWLSAVQLNFRGVMQLSDNLYLSGTGQLYYLPGDNEAGFYFANGQNTFARIAYETVIGEWEVTAFDEFRVYHRLSDIFDEVEHDEIESSGRYRFGRFSDNTSTDYFDSDSISFVNRAGVTADREFGDTVGVGARFVHNDYWNTLDFVGHRKWDQFHLRAEYTGENWRFVPFAEYYLTALDEWDVLYHSYYIGARGPLTENLRARGRVGYLHSSGAAEETARFVGDGGLTHELGPYTTHSLTGGISHYILDDGDNWLAAYGRYTINQELGAGTWASLYTQYSDLTNLDVDGDDRKGWSMGGSVTHALTEYSKLRFDVSRDEWDSTRANSTVERSRMVYRASLSQRLAPYLHGRLMYQFEDYDSEAGNSFDEQLWLLTISHTF